MPSIKEMDKNAFLDCDKLARVWVEEKFMLDPRYFVKDTVAVLPSK